jgi:ketosteroid isomerase-like protein
MAESTDPGTEAAILDANATFYRAFTEGDYDRMNGLWAQRAPVACIHPAARTLIGRAAVLESWRQILGSTSRFELRCDQPVVHVIGDVAIVSCYEGSNEEPAHLAATNVFVLEDGNWRMVHHHAGSVSNRVPRPRPSRSMN